MKKLTLSTMVIVIIAMTILIVVGSSSNLNKEQHFSIKKYKDEEDKVFTRNDTLTICTYNIGYLSGMTNNLAVKTDYKLFETNLHKAQRLFSIELVDIIGLQEIDTKASRTYHVNQVDSLAMHLHMPYCYSSINWDKKYVPFPYWPPSLHFGSIVSGQAILSRFRISTAETKVLDKPENASYFYNLFYLDRLIQSVDIALNDTTSLKILNVHLEAFDKQTRVNQAVLLKQILPDLLDKGPLLLIGDFNSEPGYVDDTDAINIILSVPGLSSAVSQEEYLSDPTSHQTYSSAQPEKMIDYILYSHETIEKISAEVNSEFGEISDHLPLFMKFKLR